MIQPRRLLIPVVVTLSALALITGCSRAVDGTAVKAGGAGPRHNDSPPT